MSCGTVSQTGPLHAVSLLRHGVSRNMRSPFSCDKIWVEWHSNYRLETRSLKGPGWKMCQQQQQQQQQQHLSMVKQQEATGHRQGGQAKTPPPPQGPATQTATSAGLFHAHSAVASPRVTAEAQGSPPHSLHSSGRLAAEQTHDGNSSLLLLVN
ncbi:hypothetical protein O3P69_019919 [Scylla paramamosain]|uniref:Uncharacterized protein n=1 Tax=Scylla paramamosain TaxID=85552 RepID=A0AAW0SJH5_SCYPA